MSGVKISDTLSADNPLKPYEISMNNGMPKDVMKSYAQGTHDA